MTPPLSHSPPPPTITPYLLGCPAAWEEVAIIVTVEGDVEDVGVAVEGLLGPVPMVDVLPGCQRCQGHPPNTILWGPPSPRGVPVPLPGGTLPSPR